MFKKIVSGFLAGVCMMTVAACGNMKENPGEVVQEFCQAMKAFDGEKMSVCLLSGENVMGEMNAEENAEAEWLIALMKQWAGKISYKADEPVINGDSATVAVTFHYVDASAAIKAALAEYLLKAFSLSLAGATDEQIKEEATSILTENIQKTGTGEAEDTAVFLCRKTKEGWKIGEAPEGIKNILSGNTIEAISGMFSGFLSDS